MIIIVIIAHSFPNNSTEGRYCASKQHLFNANIPSPFNLHAEKKHWLKGKSWFSSLERERAQKDYFGHLLFGSYASAHGEPKKEYPDYLNKTDSKSVSPFFDRLKSGRMQSLEHERKTTQRYLRERQLKGTEKLHVEPDEVSLGGSSVPESTPQWYELSEHAEGDSTVHFPPPPNGETSGTSSRSNKRGYGGALGEVSHDDSDHEEDEEDGTQGLGTAFSAPPMDPGSHKTSAAYSSSAMFLETQPVQ